MRGPGWDGRRSGANCSRTWRAKLAGSFPELEDELAGLTAAGGYERTGRGSRSPDRADAMVHAMAELMLGPRVAVPRVRLV